MKLCDMVKRADKLEITLFYEEVESDFICLLRVPQQAGQRLPQAPPVKPFSCIQAYRIIDAGVDQTKWYAVELPSCTSYSI
jgi:hypothetical protein